MSHPDDKSRSRTVYIAVAAAVLASVLTTYGLRALEGGGGGGGSVEAPDIAGLELETARERLRQRGLFLVVASSEHSDAQPADHVLSQDPVANQELDEGGSVSVVMSSGPASVAVPDLTALTVNSARQRLEEAGLSLGDRSEGGEGEPNTVTSQTPAPTTEVEAGSAVAITVAPEGFAIPEGLVGTQYRVVKQQLEDLGFVVVMRRGWNEMRPPMSVLGVEPEAGTLLPPGSEVTVRVND